MKVNDSVFLSVATVIYYSVINHHSTQWLTLISYYIYHSRNERQWRDLSFCLSLLSYSEKSLRKLQENFTCFADKLVDDMVYNCFTTIISKSRGGFAKPEAKVILLIHHRLYCNMKCLLMDKGATRKNTCEFWEGFVKIWEGFVRITW